MKPLYCVLIAFFFYGTVAAQQDEANIPVPDVKLVNNEQVFPFRFNEVNPRFDLLINLKDHAVIDRYGQLFKQYKLRFEGDVWEEVMTQILARVDPPMSREVEYMDGDDNLYIGTKGHRQNQQTYLKDMLMVLRDNAIFEGYLQTLDRTNLDEDEPEEDGSTIGNGE